VPRSSAFNLSVKSPRLVWLGLSLTLLLAACSADRPLNPSFPLTVARADEAYQQMKEHPKPLERPLVIALGFADPGVGGATLTSRLLRVLKMHDEEKPRFAKVVFWSDATFDACRRRLIARIEQAWPCDDAEFTTEVDVIGISMGGLVARYAAMPRNDGGKRLRIRQLFTISTPHRGAAMATLPSLDRRVIDMRADSPFLHSLSEASSSVDYELIPYVRLDDAIVGAVNAAPPGQGPWWIANIPGQPAHLLASSDPRIVADIARRLRNEQPFTTDPPAPLPPDR
jgi:pimeloyl-ACP methyl ester carboxylesterase